MYTGVPQPRGVIDFNSDIGESFGSYKLGMDEEIVKYVTSVNVAAGFHASDPDGMARTVALAEAAGVGIGAHPSYPDLLGFGRRDMALTTDEVRHAVTYQIGALAAFTAGHALQHVKPHGAMYNKAVRDDAEASAIVSAIKDYDPNLIHVVLAGSGWAEIARDAGVRVARESYADRAVTPDGRLVPRSHERAVIHDVEEVIERAVRIATTGRVTAIDGTEIDFAADSICLHGDTKGSVNLASALRRALETHGVEIKPLSQIV